jgi:hypothetical protein
MRKACEFFLIRYVPDPVRNEFINIGVLLREAAGGIGEGPLLKFTHDWSRVRCVDPDMDMQMLEALEEELRGRLTESGNAGEAPILQLIEESFSNTLQITSGKGCLAESMTTELNDLMRTYVEPRRRQRTRKLSGRMAIQAKMQTHFEHSGVWNLMHKRVPVSRYTQIGDPLRIDCAYRPNGVVRMFHAVSLEGDTEVAKVLSFSMPALQEGVARLEDATLQFTAIIEPLVSINGWEEDRDRVAEYNFAVDTMTMHHINVKTTVDLPHLAELARSELRV